MKDRDHLFHVSRTIRAMESAGPILEAHVEQQRGNVFVVDSLPVKGHPEASFETDLKGVDCSDDEFNTFVRFTQKHTLLTLAPSLCDPIIMLDKTQPHGLLEVMIMQGSEQMKPGICDLDLPTQRASFALMHDFSSYALGQGLYPYIAYSYDPKTADRESGQGVKRFHAHLIGRTPEELDYIRGNARLLSQIDRVRARRLVDESSIIGSQILCDRLGDAQLSEVEVIPPFADEQNPMPNAMFKLKNGWSSLATDAFMVDFNTIHSFVLEGYAEIMDCISVGAHGTWQRPDIRNVNDIALRLGKIPYLNDATRKSILHTMQKVQPSLLRKTQVLVRDEYRDVTTHVYPMGGPCYSTSFCEINGAVFCTIRPYMFSDLGGAGMGNPLGIITKVKKGIGTMNHADMQRRAAFQSGFIDHIVT
jgi:hypothetical protein